MRPGKEEVSSRDISVMQARPEQGAEIVGVLWQAWKHAYVNAAYGVTQADVQEKFGSVDEKVARIHAFLEGIPQYPNVSYLTTQTAGVVSGFVYAEQSRGEVYIHALYVRPDFQGIGIGSTLLSELARERVGAREMTANVILYNMQALVFYRKHGFVLEKIVETPFGRFPGGKVVPEIHIIKKLYGLDIS